MELFEKDLLIEDIPSKQEVVIAINRQLTRLSILDPQFMLATGITPKPIAFSEDSIYYNRWSLDSMNALRQWFALAQMPILNSEVLPSGMMKAFMATNAPNILPANTEPNNMLAYNIAIRMQKEGFYINCGLGLNTVYIEGVNIDGSLNKDRANEWNDLCIWFTVSASGTLRCVGKALCTTEPGKYYTDNPLNKNGAARIAFGQYKAWIQGLHKGIQPALVQSGGIKVHRDKDKSMTRSKKDVIEIAYAAGINQHSTGPGLKPKLVGKYSAGCLVKENYDNHLMWLSHSKNDYRVKVSTYQYVAAIIAGPI